MREAGTCCRGCGVLHGRLVRNLKMDFYPKHFRSSLTTLIIPNRLQCVKTLYKWWAVMLGITAGGDAVRTWPCGTRVWANWPIKHFPCPGQWFLSMPMHSILLMSSLSDSEHNWAINLRFLLEERLMLLFNLVFSLATASRWFFWWIMNPLSLPTAGSSTTKCEATSATASR